MRARAIVALTLAVVLLPGLTVAQPRIEQRPGRVSGGGPDHSWPTADPQDRGIDADRLEGAARLAAGNESDSLLVIHDGAIVLERYWNGKGPGDVQQTYSGTKSLFALVVGRAIERGYLRDLDQPVRELVPEMPEEQSAVTFRSVLAMESGVENSPEIEGLGRSGRTQLEIALERRIIAAPFERYHYNNVVYRLLFTALERASGKSLEELTAEEALAPLSIDGAYWVRLYAVDGDTETFIGYQSIRLTPRDFAKSAQVILDDGVWNGERYLPQSYTAALVESPAPRVNPSFGLFHHLNAGDFFRDYSVPERIDRKLVPGAPDDTFLMFGSGGQLVAGVPSLRLVIVRTGGGRSSINEEDNFFAELIRRIAESVR